VKQPQDGCVRSIIPASGSKPHKVEAHHFVNVAPVGEAIQWECEHCEVTLAEYNERRDNAGTQ
jgi:hypothetical protein